MLYQFDSGAVLIWLAGTKQLSTSNSGIKISLKFTMALSVRAPVVF